MLLVAFCKPTHPCSLLTKPFIFHCFDIYPLVALEGAKEVITPGSNQGWFRLLTETNIIANDWFGCGTFFLVVSQKKSLPMFIESYWKK